MLTHFIRALVFVSLTVFLTGCIASANDAYKVTVVSEVTLPSELKESSGLYCRDNDFYTINDSGNAPSLHYLTQKGEVNSDDLPILNRDWEAITANRSHVFIADIGNNYGKRKDLGIYKIDRQDFTQFEEIRISYQDNNPAANEKLAHDFDAEALTYVDGKLVIFSKSWQSLVTHVYEVDPNALEQNLVAQHHIEGLPGLVTGVDYDAQAKAFVVVGYGTSPFGFMRPFVAKLNADYDVEFVGALEGFTQVEGVCVKGDDVWFTQEETRFDDAKLVHITLEKTKGA